MEASSFEKSIDEWLAELNDPQVERRRYALTSLMDSGTLNERIINELKLIARGDPDSKAQALAKKVLKTHGIKILPQISNQPGAKPTGFLLSGEFWVGFFLCSILNFILFLGRPSIAFVVNVVLLIYFGLTRKNIALGMLAFLILILPLCLICFWISFSLRCWPDGCGVPR